MQFVVQLYGCNLDCPFCYVTRRGVWDTPIKVSTDALVRAYALSGANVFHLMGGAPALQMKFWPELLDALGPDILFHSDLMLTETRYDPGRPATTESSECAAGCVHQGIAAGDLPAQYQGRSSIDTAFWPI